MSQQGLMVAQTALQQNLSKIQTLLASSLEEAKSYAVQVANSISKNDKLLKLIEEKPHDFILSVCTAAELGLKVGTVEGFGWIVPYKGVPTFQIGYKGLIELACRTGVVRSIHADVVYENEIRAGLFKFTRGLNPTIVHDVDMLKNSEMRKGTIVYAYAVATLLDGSTQFYVADEIDFRAAQNNSMSFKSEYSPWKTTPQDMYRKTAIKKLLALVPKGKNDKLSRALHYDDAVDAKWANVQAAEQRTEATIKSFMDGPPNENEINAIFCPKLDTHISNDWCTDCDKKEGCPECQ